MHHHTNPMVNPLVADTVPADPVAPARPPRSPARRASRRARRAVAAAVTAAGGLVLAIVLVQPAGSMQAEVDRVDAGPYLAAYANAGDGSFRRVGSDWYVKARGEWVASSGPDGFALGD